MTGISDSGGRSRRICVHFRADIRERLVRVVIQLQTRGDGRDALRALRLDVVDAVRGRDRTFQRRGNESANEFCIRADINRRHRDRSDIASRILPNIDASSSPASRR